MTLQHTKSTDGRIHALTFTARPTGNGKRIPGRVYQVTMRYNEAPRYDDQVQGDLIRKFWETYPNVHTGPIGSVTGFSAIIDPALDETDSLPPADAADTIATTFGYREAETIYPLTGSRIREIIRIAIDADRKTR